MHPFFHILSFSLPAYGVFAALAFLSGGALAILRGKRLGLDPDACLSIVCCALLFALLGARLLYVFASYGLERAAAELQAGKLDFLKAGGMVFYGGLIGGIAGAFLGIRIAGERRRGLLARAFLPCVPLGHAIGRVGCLFAGCCYGLPYDGPASVYLSVIEPPHAVFPLPLAEAGGELLLWGLLLRLARREDAGVGLLYLYLSCYAVLRFTLEFFRGDLIRGISHGLSTSQWISLALLAAGALGCAGKKFSKKSPLDKT